MAWNKAGSGQIKDGAVLAQHIGAKAIEGKHLADKAIKDAHIDIDWSTKASAILGTKKVVDYVQGPVGITTAGDTFVDISAGVTLPEAATDADLGVIVSAPNNRVILTEKLDGNKLLTDAATGDIVFGRMASGFIVDFYTLDGGVETPYAFAEAVEYQLQYPARFTLETVSEMFAANEKFVDGVADVTTRLDVAQLVADIFGTGYVLNKDGQATVVDGGTIVELIDAVEVIANQNSGDIESIDVILSGTELDPTTGLVSRMSAAESKIATLEGHDADTRITALEDANLDDRLTTVETDFTNFAAELPKPHRADKKADIAVTEYALVDLGVLVEELPKSNTADLFINGMLQMVGEHYTEEVDVNDEVTKVVFAPNTVNVGDIVQLRWMK